MAHRGRTVMSVLVMAVSATLLVAVLSITGSVTGSADRLTQALGGKAALEVSGITDSGFDQALLPQLRAVPGVQAAVPMVRTVIGSGDDRALLIGSDPSVTQLGGTLDGPMRTQAAKLLTVPNGVLIGDAVGHNDGDHFTLGGVSLTVAGVLDARTSHDLNGGHIVVTGLPVAQKVADKVGRLDSVQIVAAPNTDVAQLRSTLTTVVGGRAVVADPSLRSAQAGGAMQLMQYSTFMASMTALIVSGFLIYNVMSMAVAQRRPVLSLLRAIGGHRAPMVRGLILESALLGLFGALLGSGIGVLAGRFAIGAMPAAILESVEARTDYVLPWYAIPVAIAACVAASSIAAAVAARQIYKVRPIEALAPVGVSKSDVAHPLLRWAAGIGGIALIGTAIVVASADIGKLSLGGISMSITGALLLCYVATGPIVALAAAIARVFGAPGALAATTLERAPRRVWATAMTVMIGITATVALGNASNNLEDSAVASFRSLGDTDIYVSSAGDGVFPTGTVLPSDLKARIGAIPGVAGVGSAQMAFATVGSGRVMLQAYQSGLVASPVLHEVAPDVLARVDSGSGVVVSRDVARTLGLHVGSALDLPTPTGVHHVEVLAVVPYFSAVAGVVVLGLDTMRDWYQRPGETILGVDVAPGADRHAVLAAVQAASPPELNVYTGPDSVDAISAGVRQGTQLSGSILWIVVLVSTAALLNTLMLSVLERRRELGVLRAMGSGRRFLLRSVLAEAAGIGIAGALLGLTAGAAAQVLADRAMGHALSLDIAYRPSPMLVVYAAAALALALAGSIPPALRAARMPIIEALAVD
ncbi:FtsX-like permease family protein [Nocardia stercoris]|uniref:FtsX-like permease family protein n=2 Tax=Nocardia stercoris TaxID=2483361 RepID=A0A3M2LE62_9NOCA|nr:FtsX-like permease family protein [Nocardia stercoris]